MVRLPPVLIQPIAADDVAGAVGEDRIGRSSERHCRNRGPEAFRLDELVRQALTHILILVKS